MILSLHNFAEVFEFLSLGNGNFVEFIWKNSLKIYEDGCMDSCRN